MRKAVQSKMERPEYSGADCVCLLIRGNVAWQWLGKQKGHSVSEGRHLQRAKRKRNDFYF